MASVDGRQDISPIELRIRMQLFKENVIGVFMAYFAVQSDDCGTLCSIFGTETDKLRAGYSEDNRTI